jgi:thioredoxin 1
MEKYKEGTDIKSGKVVLKFSAAWCAPCRALAPKLDKLLEPFGETLKSYEVDIDDHFELSNTFQIKGVPTAMFLNNGSLVAQVVGLRDESVYTDALKALSDV